MKSRNTRLLVVVCLTIAIFSTGDPMIGQGTAVPSPWASRDIGSPAIAGSATFDQASGTFSIDAAGADIWDASDQFHFVYQPLAGDGVITARVDTLGAADQWSKAGVMIRSSLNADAAHAYALVSAGRGAVFQRRHSVGGTSVATADATTTVAPLWLRMDRSGPTVTASMSSNGTTWTTMGSDTVALDAVAYVGLAVTSHNVAQSTSAVLSSVTVTKAGALPSPWASRDIGGPAIAGSAAFDPASETFAIDAAGADIWDAFDQFHFVYQPLAGDGVITARVNSLSAVDEWSKAGVMIRSSLEANAAHALAHVSASRGAVFQRRRTVGDISVATADAPTVRAPLWLRIARSGVTVTASMSANGTTWTTMGSDTIALNATAYVGLAVTSHNVAQSTSAVLSSVTVTTAGALPTPWKSQDIDNPAIAGSAAFSGGTYTVTAAGRNISNNADQFHYVYQPMTGDMDVSVRVVSFTGVPLAARAGVMIRETLTAGSSHALAALSRDGRYMFQRRATTGGTTVTTAVAGTTPGWVRLKRTGDLVSAYRSVDGITWTAIGSDSFPMADTVYVGIAVTSRDVTAAVTATLTNLVVNQSLPPNQPPTVTLTAPANGGTFTAPATIAVTASASDADGTVARVDFYNGSTLLASDPTAPYAFTWSNVAAGTYALTATSIDNAGASASSATATVTVTAAGNQLPTATLSAPANGATFTAPATIALTASASDPDGTVARVDFYNGTTLLASDATAPYAFTWSSVAAGTYALKATAVDNTGASGSSAVATVTVSAANQPPTVTLTAPANGATYVAPASVTLTANAADANGSVARVEFYNGAALLGTDTLAPYAFAWSGVPAGTYALRAIAYDNVGASTTSATATITVSAPPPPPPPTAVVFQASTDHALVTSYLLEIFSNGANTNTATPVASSNLGKPAPGTNGDITVNRATLFSALAPGTYLLVVSSIGTDASSRSVPLTFVR
jgi:regulation of enolase protein 1 (concanavalin A-like superfamily)